MNILDRFYSKLKQSDDCLLWTPPTNNSGYGIFRVDNDHLIPAHQFAYILFYKVDIKGEIHHKCENKLCCNPLHLEDINKHNRKEKHIKEYCKYGHEISVVGRYKNGNCAECQKLRSREERYKLLLPDRIRRLRRIGS